MPSLSAMRQHRYLHTSSKGYQSEQLRDKRVTSGGLEIQSDAQWRTARLHCLTFWVTLEPSQTNHRSDVA
jgi:hypothetical protein